MHDRIILVFGASIVWGNWDGEGGWVQRLKRVTDGMSIRDKKRDIMLYNLGVPGDSTRELLKRVKPEMNARVDEGEEVTLIFSVGSNDSYCFSKEGSFNVTPEEYRENLAGLLGIARESEARAIFVGFPTVDRRVDPVPWRPEISYKIEHVKEYNDILREFCRENGPHFIDIFKLFEGREKELLEDGVHPNSEGHKLIFEAVRDFLARNGMI
jgi:lysophospholipase L1-like esterase